MFATPPLESALTSFPMTMIAKCRALSLEERVKKQGIPTPPPKPLVSIPLEIFGRWRGKLQSMKVSIIAGNKDHTRRGWPDLAQAVLRNTSATDSALRWCTGSINLGGLIGIHDSSGRYHLSPQLPASCLRVFSGRGPPRAITPSWRRANEISGPKVPRAGRGLKWVVFGGTVLIFMKIPSNQRSPLKSN